MSPSNKSKASLESNADRISREADQNNSSDTDSREHVAEKVADHSREEKFFRQEQQPHQAQPALLSFFGDRSVKRDPNECATQPSVFDDPEQAKFYQPHPHYENLHRFDPSFTWTWGQEKALTRKLDWRVTGWAWMAYLALNLDASCVIQANADNLLTDLGMTTNGVTLSPSSSLVFADSRLETTILQTRCTASPSCVQRYRHSSSVRKSGRIDGSLFS